MAYVNDLSPLDAAFLYAEKSRAPMHVAGLQIYDRSTAPGNVDAEAIVAKVGLRAPLIDRFHRKLLTTPLRLDHPHWVEDGAFRAERHVRSIELPAPGSWAELMAAVAGLLGQPLPRDRPLWEMVIITGLHGDGFPEDAFAVLTKLHHAAVDGVAGVGVTAALHDLSPDPPAAERLPPRPEATHVAPSMLALSGWLKLMLRPLRFMATAPTLGQALGSLAAVRALPAPPTPLNRRISGARTFDGLRVPLAVLQACRKIAPGAKINDVALTLIGGALRRYLSRHDALPDESLTALVPVSKHAAGTETDTGNQINQITATLGTNVEDPACRMTLISARTREAKAAIAEVDQDGLMAAVELAPPALVAAVLGSGVFAPPRLVNTVVTNVKGPPLPLYLCGAKLTHVFCAGPIADGLALFHTVLSYCDEFTVSVLACPERVPDLDFYMLCLRDELEVMKAAVGP